MCEIDIIMADKYRQAIDGIDNQSKNRQIEIVNEIVEKTLPFFYKLAFQLRDSRVTLKRHGEPYNLVLGGDTENSIDDLVGFGVKNVIEKIST